MVIFKSIRYKCKFLLLAFLMLFGTYVVSGQNIYSFERIGVIQGLSQNTVTCIFQDYQGYIWFGTKDGLNRYDGYNFKPFIHDAGNEGTLPNSDISTLFEDSDNNLWIGTDGGLSRYDRSEDRFYNYSEGLLSLNVRMIVEQDKETLWVATYLGGLHKFDKRTGVFEAYSDSTTTGNKGSMNIRTVQTIGDHKLWIGSEDGIRVFDRQKAKYEGKVSFYKDYSIESGKINAFHIDQDGNYWIGTYGNGIKKLPKSSDHLEAFVHDPTSEEGLSNNFILAIAELGDRIFFGTSYGLNIFNKKTETFQVINKGITENSLSSNRIRSILIDNVGIMWVGTDNGINVYDPGREKFASRGNTAQDLELFPNNSIRSIYKESDSIVWLGSDGGGLIRLDRITNETAEFNILNGKLTSNIITNILPKDNQHLWLGTETDGLLLFNKADGRVVKHYQYYSHKDSLSSNNIRKIILNKRGGLWVATDGGGLNYFNFETEKFRPYKSDPNNPQALSSNFITSLWEEPNGNLWIGTYGGGISHLDIANQLFTSYTSDSFDSTSLSSNLVNALLKDDDNKLWIGTYSGLNCLDTQSGRFSQYTPNSSKSYTINAIVKDEQGVLWLSSNKGLLSFNATDSSFKIYDVKDGLSDNQFATGAFHQGTDGEIFFGSPNGYTSFYPKDIKPNSFKPPIVLTNFFLSNKLTPVGIGGDSPLSKSIGEIDQLVLNYDQRDFSIEFSALNYRLPEKNQYRYKLEGYLDDWIIADANKRIATYTNLEPKEYVFKVEAANNDGVWNHDGIILPIKITTPWWKTNAAKTFYVLLALLAVFLVYRLRIRQIERTKQELKEQVHARTKEIEEKNEELFQKAEELASQKEEILQINDKLESMFDQLEKERDKSENMLLNILPKETAKELKEKGNYTPRHYKMVSVLFTDFKGFTSIAEKLSPSELIKELDYFFQYFDKVVEKHNLEKIKTIGDAYMCAGGIPKPNVTNAIDTVLAGLEITQFTHRVNKERIANGRVPWELRVGINTGELVSGVVGKKKFAYDVWGDAVNLASRMESSAAPGKVNISGNTYEFIKSFFETEYRGKVFAKGKGEVDMYYVNRIKPELSLDEDGFSPNADFRIKVKELLMNPKKLQEQ